MTQSVRGADVDADLLIFDIFTGDAEAAPAGFDRLVRGLSRAACCSPDRELALQTVSAEPAWDEILYAEMFSGDAGSEEPVPGKLA